MIRCLAVGSLLFGILPFVWLLGLAGSGPQAVEAPPAGFIQVGKSYVFSGAGDKFWKVGQVVQVWGKDWVKLASTDSGEPAQLWINLNYVMTIAEIDSQ